MPSQDIRVLCDSIIDAAQRQAIEVLLCLFPPDHVYLVGQLRDQG